MNFETIMTLNEKHKVVFDVHGKNLYFKARRGVMTPELKQALKDHKKLIMLYLSGKGCYCCNSFSWWRVKGRTHWICGVCHPPATSEEIEWCQLPEEVKNVRTPKTRD